MAQIGFTKKQESVYNRFNAMRRAYEDAHGRTYAPDFLSVLMDAFEMIEGSAQSTTMSLLDLLNATKDLDGLTPDEIAALDEAIEECKPVSLRAYIADVEANNPNLQPENETE